MFRHLTLAFLVLAAVPAAAIAPGADPCAGSSLPYALNIGLPRLPDTPGFRAVDLEQGVQKLIGTFYARHGRCPERKLQVNITVAGDYEILDWLGQGLIDVAIVPDLTIHLLAGDGIRLREMDLTGHRLGGLLLPALKPQPRSARLVRFQWQRRPDPKADLAAFQEQTWRLATNPPEKPEPQEYRVVFASHLSTLGFLAPLEEAGRDLERRLGSIPEREKTGVRERFWQAFFDNARFAVDCDSLTRDSPGTRSCWRLPDAEERAGTGPVEILFPGEGVLRPLAGPSAQVGSVPLGRYREHLVMAKRS
ncbi:MAG TPA: hypothetical protein VEL74_25140, partial [Thermoanaerobaculia bacterium]|nr:hypothetical protein [Thermoanaerobaculia bacterium]